MSRLTPFGFLFGKSLTDLIRGIRRHTDPEKRAEYLRSVIAECRDEVRSPDLDVKTTAILKLAYLGMLGYDMTWAGFHVIEVMASPHFQQKRIGYLAAMQSFRSDSELLMLVTNLVKMDLVNQNQSTVAIALSGLATIVTPLLAADIADDIMRMLGHSKSYIRKKAVLALHNVVLQYPEALPSAIKRMGDLLDQAQQDLSDPGNVSVVGATVSVICELSAHSASIEEFLELIPRLYDIFTASQHNWTLIKLLKIFKLFTKREPRLKSRLLPPVEELLRSTEAESLIYEAIICIIEGGMLEPEDYPLAHDISRYATDLLDKKDPNLSFVATDALNKLAQINPQFVPNTTVNGMLRVSQPDPETRKHVLALASRVVDDDSFYEITTELLTQLSSTNSTRHQTDIAETISRMAATNNYEFVPDFQWLINDVFGELCKKVRPLELGRRLLDIVIRVRDDTVREAASSLCYELINSSSSVDASSEFEAICWWIVGEFPPVLHNPLEFLNRVKTISAHRSSPEIVTTLAKVISKIPAGPEELDITIEVLTQFSYSSEYELQSRACQFLELLKLARSSPEQSGALLHDGLASLFTAYELAPIATGSQLKIRPPADLDLETPVKNLAGSLATAASKAAAALIELDSSDESEPETASSYMETSADQQPQQDGEEEEASGSDRQLYNLSRLESLRESASSAAPSVRLQKPLKKKVVIAAEETVEGPPAQEPSPAPSKRAPTMFKSGFRGSSSQIIEPDEFLPAEVQPVKVKHKKKKKVSKKKTQPHETEQDAAVADSENTTTAAQ